MTDYPNHATHVTALEVRDTAPAPDCLRPRMAYRPPEFRRLEAVATELNPGPGDDGVAGS